MPRLRFPDHALVLRMVEHCVASGDPLMLAHDEGVYLCIDAIRDDAGRCVCAYAAGCNPNIDADWYDRAHSLVGGDDFGERLSLLGATRLLHALRAGERLLIDINRRSIEFLTVRPTPTTPAARGRGAGSPSTARTRNGNMSTTKTKSTKKAKPSGERLKKEAQAEIGERIAALEAAESGAPQEHEVPSEKERANDANLLDFAKSKSSADDRPTPKAAKGGKAKATRAKDAPKANTGGHAAKPAKAAAKKPRVNSKEAKPKRMSALDAAAIVLKSSKEPMNAAALIEEMSKRKLWTSPNGATPEQTLYAALGREIASKGKASRFVKADRGLFASNPRA